jgi:hypothetical protein
MSDLPSGMEQGFLVRREQPLIGVLVEVGDQEMVRYFTDEAGAEAGTPETGVERALNVLGAWADLDWDEVEAELDRIRHANPPTPPIDL